MLSKTGGSGTLILAGANTNTGTVLINQGVVQVQSATALGAAASVAVVAGGAAVQTLATGVTFTKTLVLNGTGINGGGALEDLAGGNNSNTWSGAITLFTGASIGADAGTSLTLSGGISVSGPGDFTKVGVGTVVLSVADSYTGNTNVAANAGILSITNGGALGLPGGGVTVNSGATLQLSNTITVPGKALTLSGTGFGYTNNNALTQGALAVNSANVNIWTGAVTLTGTVGLTAGTIPLFSNANSSSTIGAISGGTLTITGAVSGTDLTLVGAGAIALNAVNTYTGNTTVLGPTVTLANNNTSAVGSTTVSGMATNSAFTPGKLTITNLGTLGTSAITIDQGGTLLLDNTLSGANVVNANITRLTNGAKPAVTSNSGTFTFQALNLANATSSETVGAYTLSSGQSTISAGFTAAPAAGATSTVTSASLARSTGATVNFLGGTGNVSPLGTGHESADLQQRADAPAGHRRHVHRQRPAVLRHPATAAPVGNILTFAEVNGGTNTGDFATYTASGIAPFANYVTQSYSASGTLSTTLSTDIVKATSTAAAAKTLTANHQSERWGASVPGQRRRHAVARLSVPDQHQRHLRRQCRWGLHGGRQHLRSGIQATWRAGRSTSSAKPPTSRTWTWPATPI